MKNVKGLKTIEEKIEVTSIKLQEGQFLFDIDGVEFKTTEGDTLQEELSYSHWIVIKDTFKNIEIGISGYDSKESAESDLPRLRSTYRDAYVVTNRPSHMQESINLDEGSNQESEMIEWLEDNDITSYSNMLDFRKLFIDERKSDMTGASMGGSLSYSFKDTSKVSEDFLKEIKSEGNLIDLEEFVKLVNIDTDGNYVVEDFEDEYVRDIEDIVDDSKFVGEEGSYNNSMLTEPDFVLSIIEVGGEDYTIFNLTSMSTPIFDQYILKNTGDQDAFEIFLNGHARVDIVFNDSSSIEAYSNNDSDVWDFEIDDEPSKGLAKSLFDYMSRNGIKDYHSDRDEILKTLAIG